MGKTAANRRRDRKYAALRAGRAFVSRRKWDTATFVSRYIRGHSSEQPYKPYVPIEEVTWRATDVPRETLLEAVTRRDNKKKYDIFVASLPRNCPADNPCFTIDNSQVCREHFIAWTEQHGNEWSKVVMFNKWHLTERMEE